MFATSFGNVRRNDLSDFVQINRNGKIAMKPSEGERIIGVETCNENDDVLLTSSSGRAIRFPIRCACSAAEIQPACAALSLMREPA